MNSKAVWKIYNELIKEFGNEFNILLNLSKEELSKVLKNQGLIDLILKNRQGNIPVQPGFDGQYGIPLIGERQSKLI